MRISLAFKNKRDSTAQVWVEPWPDCFNLKPGENLIMEFECSDPDKPLNVELTDDCLVLWPNTLQHPSFSIDGQPANDRSWRD